MGQHYYPIILANKNLLIKDKEVILFYSDSWVYHSGSKLLEHAYIENPFVTTFEYQLSKYGMYYNSRVVWAGDYADPEKDENGNEKEQNLYHILSDMEEGGLITLLKIPSKETWNFRYIVNHSKNEFIDKKGRVFHPLPLLTAEGNGRGSGDYRGNDENFVGRWARDYISVEEERPHESSGYTEIICTFECGDDKDFQKEEDEDDDLSD